jgi:hypothetical protein
MKLYHLATTSVVDSRKMGYVEIIPGGFKPISQCTQAERISAGYLDFAEVPAPANHTPGAPHDERTGEAVYRTYPNAVLDEDAQTAAADAAILAQIADLEALQTPRLVREAQKKKACTINKPGCVIDGMSPEDAMDAIDAAADALRAQLVNPVYYQVERG